MLTRFLNINVPHQSSFSYFTPLSYLRWRLFFRSYTIFLEKYLSFFGFFWVFGFPENNFWVFSSVPHLVDNYANIVDDRGRNLMCDRTLPSLIVVITA